MNPSNDFSKAHIVNSGIFASGTFVNTGAIATNSATSSVGAPGAETPAANRREPEPDGAIRIVFAVDIVGFSVRSDPDRRSAAQRMATLLDEVLDDLRIAPADTSQEPSGDGVIVVLPGTALVHEILPRLLASFSERLRRDNARYTDRLRLRLAVTVGPVADAALGFRDGTVIEVSRLLDSAVARTAIAEHDQVNIAALVSDHLHRYVLGEGQPGLNPDDFHRHDVQEKNYSAPAWLWTAG